MLTEEEWQLVSPHLSNALAELMAYRQEHGCTLAEASERAFGRRALELYEQITGFKEINVNAVWHHRLSMYGPSCQACGKPLRTPEARYCAICGAPRVNVPEGQA